MFMLKLQRTINKLELESKSSEPGGKKIESKTINLRKSFLGYERLACVKINSQWSQQTQPGNF